MRPVAMPALYTFRRCPYAIRARLALQVTQSECELREVVLRNKPASMIAASPKATVPVLLREGEQVLEESLDIMLWSLRRRDPQHWLEPEAGDLDEAIALITRNDEEFKHHLDRYKYSNRHADEVQGIDHRAEASVFLRDLQVRLSVAPWLMGQALSLADAAIAPFVRQFANTDRTWFDAQPWPQLIAWLDDFLASEILSSVMDKYPPWQPGDEVTIFPGSRASAWRRCEGL